MKTLTLTLCAALLAAGSWADIIPSRFAPMGRLGSYTDWLFFNYGQSVSGFGTFDMVRQQSTVANTYTNGPASGTTDGSFAGGVLAPNGKVIFVPFASDLVGIYDPVANTYTNGPASGTLDGNFYGGVLAPNGKVIFVPRDSDYVGIYDPIANTYTNGPASGTANGNFISGVLAPNGKVILVPYASDYVGIYDPGCGSIDLKTKLTHPIINKL
jgi:hypothetical protein